jgi:RNA polymerase sigma-70 factor (ECF subfamily)
MESFEQVYETHFSFVWRTLRGLGLAEVQAQDAAQDVFLIVYRRLPEFDGRAAVRTWLFQIALRVASDHRRRVRRKGTEPLEETVVDSTPGPEERTEQTKALQQLQHLLDLLPEEQRLVLLLTEWEEMTGPEVAALLDISVNTVASRLRRAREALLQQLRLQEPLR